MVVVILVESWLWRASKKVQVRRSLKSEAKKPNKHPIDMWEIVMSVMKYFTCHWIPAFGCTELPNKTLWTTPWCSLCGRNQGSKQLWQNTTKSSLVIQSTCNDPKGHQEQVSIKHTIQELRWRKLQKHLWIAYMALKRMSLTTSSKGVVECGKETNTRFFFRGLLDTPPPSTFLIEYVFPRPMSFFFFYSEDLIYM